MKLPCLVAFLSYLVETSSFHYLQSSKVLFPRTALYSQNYKTGDAPYRRKRTEGDEIDFGSVLRKCKYSNDYQPAIELAERALLLRPMPPSILTGVIKVFGEAGQLGRAVALLRSMKEELNVIPNEYHLGALIVACRRCGQWEMAVALFNRMDSLNVPKNTIICNNIISTLGDALQWRAVFEILVDMNKLGIKKDIVTYSSAITACVKAGEWEHALTLYQLMGEEGIVPNTITLNAVLSACARGRQVKLALDLFSDACKKGAVVDTISYSAVIKVCGDVNEFDIALRLFLAMGEVENEVEDDVETEVENAGLVQGNVEGKNEGSKAGDGSAVSVYSTDSSDSSIEMYSTLKSIWNSSSGSQFTSEYVNRIISNCKKVPRDTGCYNAMITCCERAGKWRIALDLLYRMERINIANSGSGSSSSSNSSPISRANNIPSTSSGSSSTLTSTSTYKSSNNNYVSRSSSSSGSSSGSSSYSGSGIGSRIFPDCKTYSAAISCCGKQGQWEEAEKLFNKMTVDGKSILLLSLYLLFLSALKSVFLFVCLVQYSSLDCSFIDLFGNCMASYWSINLFQLSIIYSLLFSFLFFSSLLSLLSSFLSLLFSTNLLSSFCHYF